MKKKNNVIDEEVIEKKRSEKITKTKVNKLNIGQEIKNYKELCSILEIPEKTHQSKQAQLKELQRYVAFERRGQKYIITDIYKKPLEKDDDRFGIFTKCIEIILMYNFAHPEQNYYFKTAMDGDGYSFYKTCLWKSLGLVNESFGKKDLDEINEDAIEYNYVIPEAILSMFYQMSTQRINRLMERALNSMESRFILSWHREMKIVYEKKIGENVIKEGCRDATEEEEKEVLRIENEIMISKYGCKSKYQLMVKKKYDDFYKDVNEALYKEHGWLKAPRKIRIVASPEAAQNTYDFLEKDFMLENKDKLNVAVADNLIAEAQRLYNTSLEKVEAYDTAYSIYNEEMHNTQKICDNAMNRILNGECEFLQDAVDAETKRINALKPEGKRPFQYPDGYVLATKILANELIMLKNNSSAIDLLESAKSEKGIGGIDIEAEDALDSIFSD